MFEQVKVNGLSVVIDIKEEGIYSLGNNSSLGKTHVAKLLRNQPFAYVVKTTEEELILLELDRFSVTKASVLVFDRFDLYRTPAIIKKLRTLTDKYVLLDYKNYYVAKELTCRLAYLLDTSEGYRIEG